MRMQMSGVTVIILITVGVICYLVNNVDYGYNANAFNNLEFNVLCAILAGMGLMSLIFIKDIDVYSLLHINEDPTVMEKESEEDSPKKRKFNSCGCLLKTVVTLLFTILVLRSVDIQSIYLRYIVNIYSLFPILTLQ